MLFRRCFLGARRGEAEIICLIQEKLVAMRPSDMNSRVVLDTLKLARVQEKKTYRVLIISLNRTLREFPT